jgi:hypothetical protein
MEREQIIKALECCYGENLPQCIECPFKENKVDCFGLGSDSLALIKELAEENEKLLTALANYDRQTDVRIAEEYYTAEAYEELREENERLRADNEILKMPRATIFEIADAFDLGRKKGKADTVRETQEALKECIKGVYLDEAEMCAIIDEVAGKILNGNTEEEKK